jgi:hypothetical protein
VARSRGETLFRKDAVRARDKRLRLRKQTLDWVGFPPIKHTVPSGPICPVPCRFQGAGLPQRPTKSPVGIAATRAPSPDLCQPSLRLQRLPDGPTANTKHSSGDDATTYANHSTDRREMNGRLHASAVLLNRIIHMRCS